MHQVTRGYSWNTYPAFLSLSNPYYTDHGCSLVYEHVPELSAFQYTVRTVPMHDEFCEHVLSRICVRVCLYSRCGSDRLPYTTTLSS